VFVVRRRFIVGLACAGFVACGLNIVGSSGGGAGATAESGTDGPGGQSTDGHAGDDGGDDNGVLGTPDAKADVGADAPEGGGTVDAGCPAVCNGGCSASGTKCLINVTTARTNITCPPGFDCRIDCNSNQQVCNGIVQCPAGHVCTLVCRGAGQSCNALDIQKNGATSLCIECSGTNQCCNSLTCSSTMCTTYCLTASACNGDCNCDNVDNAGACP
jgi:hypothetical protein